MDSFCPGLAGSKQPPPQWGCPAADGYGRLWVCLLVRVDWSGGGGGRSYTPPHPPSKQINAAPPPCPPSTSHCRGARVCLAEGSRREEDPCAEEPHTSAAAGQARRAPLLLQQQQLQPQIRARAGARPTALARGPAFQREHARTHAAGRQARAAAPRQSSRARLCATLQRRGQARARAFPSLPPSQGRLGNRTR